MKIENRKYVAIVGSRETPIWALELMIRLGRTYTDLGIGISSGDAYGADRAGWYGAIQSKRYDEVGARIYIHKNGFLGRDAYSTPNFYNARDLNEHREMAKAMAFKARGNFYGLGPGGIELHTRNVYQICGHNLDNPVKACIYYGVPKTTLAAEKVWGGTNTAVQIAKAAEIPIRINLWATENVEWAENFLKKHEKDYPYKEINWHEILDPNHEYFKDFE